MRATLTPKPADAQGACTWPHGFGMVRNSMASPDEIQIIFCTVPDIDSGERIARRLVEQKLAACVNLIPGMTSVYRWQGKVETGNEVLMKIKAARARYAAIESTIRSQHPYELPEIIAVSLSNGLGDYLDWVLANCKEAL